MLIMFYMMNFLGELFFFNAPINFRVNVRLLKD